MATRVRALPARERNSWLVHRSPEIATLAADGDEVLVDMPIVAETALATAKGASAWRVEIPALNSDRLAGNTGAELGKRIFDDPRDQAESVLEPCDVAEIFGRMRCSRSIDFTDPWSLISGSLRVHLNALPGCSNWRFPTRKDEDDSRYPHRPRSADYCRVPASDFPISGT